MSRDQVLIVTLVVLNLLTLAALVVALSRLSSSQRETRSVSEQLSRLQTVTPGRRAAAQAVQSMVSTAVTTAARVRERGVVGGLVMAPIEDLARWARENRAEIDKVAAPDGTVTLLFSDIEDSTATNERLGDEAWVKVLEAHDRLVREQVERHRGHVVKTQGDGFMVAFGKPADAVRCAWGVQQSLASAGSATAPLTPSGRRLRRTPLTVRIGIHTGQVVARDGDYFGRNVALAARVAGQADGGETLVTDAVREALADDAEFAFRPREEAELKGLAGSHVLWLVEAS